MIGIIELLLSTIILFNIVNNHIGITLITVLYSLITVLLVSHGITLLTRTFVRNKHFEARIAGSNCYKIKLEAIIDTKKVLKPNNKKEYTDDEKLLELLPEIIIENKYDRYEYLINGNNSVNNLNYQDLVTHFSKKYDTNNNVYSILDKFSQQDTTVWELPGLNCYLNNTVFKNFVKLDDAARQEYEKLYFKIIDKLEYYVKTYPQYLDNEYGYNKLRILLTISTIKELDKMNHEKQLTISYIDNVNHQIEKDRKKEIDSIFKNNINQEITSL